MIKRQYGLKWVRGFQEFHEISHPFLMSIYHMLNSSQAITVTATTTEN